MNLVRQPKGSNLCGQACVATLADICLEESIMVFRTKSYTTTKKVRQALWQLGIESAPRLTRGFPEFGTAILKWTWPCGHSHWCIWHKGKYYDPSAGVSRKSAKYLKEAKVTSYLQVYV